MSRRTRAGSISLPLPENQTQMSPQPTQEAAGSVMGPPPVPTTSIINPATGNVVATTNVPGRMPEEIEEKYNKLKRKYQELEEKHKETVLQLQRSGERNIKLRDERSALMDRIAELQGDVSRDGPQVDLFGSQPNSSAYSKAMISNRARQAFEANLNEAAHEAQMEDVDTDPASTSNHIGPASRQRLDQQHKERHEEDIVGAGKEATPAALAPPKKTPVRRTKKQTAQAPRDSSTPSASVPPAQGSSSTSVFAAARGDGSPFTAPATSSRRIILIPPVPPPVETPADTPDSGSPSSMAIDIPHISQLQSQANPYPDVAMSDANIDPRLTSNHSFREAPPIPDPPNSGSFQDEGGGDMSIDREPHSLSPSHSFREAPPDPERDKLWDERRRDLLLDDEELTSGDFGEVDHDDFTAPIYQHSEDLKLTVPALVHDPYSSPASLSPVTPTQVPTVPLLRVNSFVEIQDPSVLYPVDLHSQPLVKHEHEGISSATLASTSFNQEEDEDRSPSPALIAPIRRNPDGLPALPRDFGFCTIQSLGSISPRPIFHSTRYIYPIGYTILRRFLSISNPYQRTFYQCCILEGPHGPRFQMIPTDNPHRALIGDSADDVWYAVSQAAKLMRGAAVSPSRALSGSERGTISGEEFFGLERAEVRAMIQELPGAADLSVDVGGKYVWTDYVEDFAVLS